MFKLGFVVLNALQVIDFEYKFLSIFYIKGLI